ncbi:non-canonical purine NTP pyrophosphatase, RdgB/HAM1 family [Candidatus Poribacteria bacterium]|nr:non-canonical purine NTP pyrophosphatase, RdgB/HAM1 family [Candidatus Poribacteria bacterium]
MKLTLATRNPKKIEEIRSILGHQFEVTGMDAISASSDLELIEDCQTFAGNAILKAVSVAKATQQLALADDSGLVVDALDGAPGVHSARYAGENTTDEVRNQKLLHALKDIPYSQRTARFQCAIAMADKEGKIEVVEGVCQGEIAHQPKGDQGFGYDPVFVPDGYQQTFAQLGATVKNRISHRRRALALAAKVVQNWI